MFKEQFYQRILRLAIIIVIMAFAAFQAKSQVFLRESFEIGAKPVGWTEEYAYGTEPWRFRNGGHSPNDNNWLVPPQQIDITRNPPSAYDGTFNAIFFKQGDGNERTKLITPVLNLLGGTSVELNFFLCQIPWTFEGSTGWDVLRVYYKVSESSPWILLHEYLDPVYEWTQQTLILPNLSSTYYIGFEGHTRWGYGTCIDKISIEEKGSQPLWIKEINFKQPFLEHVPSGYQNVPVMRIDFTVLGNTGSAKLDHIQFTSLNTTDSDLQSNGVKLFATSNQTFNTANPVGSPVNYISGIASFSNLNYSLPPGQSYLWLAYDVKTDAVYGNILDAKIAANSIMANDTLYPATEKSPLGNRTIYKTQYFVNFDGVHNWSLSGEFQVNNPAGAGGLPGNPDPLTAFSGNMVLGTDLTGLGSQPGNYEPDLSESTSYLATSPPIDLFYYKNLNLFFQRYLNMEVWDHASVLVSTDDGNTWNSIWESSTYLNDFQWTLQQIPVPDAYSRTNNFKIRFKLGPTDGQNNYSGWNIDDIYLTGEFISKDVGISDWIYPLSGSGHSANDSVIVRIRNFGGAEIKDPVPVAYSFDGGITWTVNNMTQNIPVGGSVIFTFPTKADLSIPGMKPSVLAKTMLPGDQYTGNDQISTQIYIVPTFKPPYMEDYESNDGFWRSSGNKIWEYGTPAKSVINKASSGTQSWITGLNLTYGDIIARKNRVIFDDDFESDRGWTYTGEFERNIPNNMQLPYFAYSGYYCIGTDLSGKGLHPFNYEPGISDATAYKATTPAFDVRNYSNLKISLNSWITVQNGDSIKLEVSQDNGISWITIWKNSEGAIIDADFTYREFSVPDSLSFSSMLKIRFSLFYSSASGPVAQGWSIDDFLLTGDLVNEDAGYLSSPSYDLTGLTNPLFEAHLWIETEQNVDGATLLYSLDDGQNWSQVSNSSGFDTYWNWYTGKQVEALGSNGWSGQSNGWITVRHLLPTALIGQHNVQFRLKFMADKFNNQFDGIAIDNVRIIEAPFNVGVTEILSPATACELGPAQRFILRLQNYGVKSLLSGDSIRIRYNINRSGEIQVAEETIRLTQAFPPGTSQNFNMTKEFDFSLSGEYQINVSTIESDPSFYYEVPNNNLNKIIRVNKPLVDLGPDVSTIRPDTVVFKAYSGVSGNSYLWQDGSVDSVYNVSTEGTYYVKVTNKLGCVASDTARVTQLIPDVGVTQLISPFSACEVGENVPVRVIIQNLGTDTIDVNDSIFVFRDINSILLQDTIFVKEKLAPGSTLNYSYSKYFNFSLPGTYNMKLYTRFRDDFRNNNDTLNYTLEVYGYPSVNLGRDTIVMAPQYILSADPGYFSYLWQDGSTLNTFTVDQPGSGIYKVIVSDEHQCTSSDSVRVTLNVTDIALERILSPATSCGLSESVSVSARIKNIGNQSVPSGQTITLGYQVDGNSLGSESVLLTDTFSPGDSIDFVFSQNAQVLTGHWYDFTVYVNYASDMKSSNDTIVMPVGVFATPVVNLGEDFKVVTALEYTLDAGPGFSSYLWHDGSVNQTFTIKNPGINTCSVTVTDLNGCRAYDEIQVMLAVPDIGIKEVVNPKTSCNGEINEYVQVAIQNYGNWDIEKSADISVRYSVNGMAAVTEKVVLETTFENGAVIYHTFSNPVDFNIPGHYVLETTTLYGSDLISSNDNLNVNVDILKSPVVDIGNGQDTILVYDPLTLSAPAGYESYKWQDGSTNPDYEIGNPGAGIYSVMVSDYNGCSTRDSVYVAYDTPDIGITRILNPVSSCLNSNHNPLSIEIVNNGYYRISKDSNIIVSYSINNGVSTAESVKLTSNLLPGNHGVLELVSGFDFPDPGNYLLNVILDYGPDQNLSDNSLNNSISIWDLPEIEIGNGKDTIITGLPFYLEAAPGFSSYLWQDNSVTNRINVVRFGLHWVVVTDDNGCAATDSVYVFSVTNVDDPQIYPEGIKIYPNPVEDILNVMMKMDVSRNVFLELFNMSNAIVYKEELEQVQLVNHKIDASELVPGVYFLRITVDQIQHTYKVIVK